MVSWRDYDEQEWVDKKDFGDINIIQQYWKSHQLPKADEAWMPDTLISNKKNKSDKKVQFADEQSVAEPVALPNGRMTRNLRNCLNIKN